MTPHCPSGTPRAAGRTGTRRSATRSTLLQGPGCGAKARCRSRPGRNPGDRSSPGRSPPAPLSPTYPFQFNPSSLTAAAWRADHGAAEGSGGSPPGPAPPDGCRAARRPRRSGGLPGGRPPGLAPPDGCRVARRPRRSGGLRGVAPRAGTVMTAAARARRPCGLGARRGVPQAGSGIRHQTSGITAAARCHPRPGDTCLERAVTRQPFGIFGGTPP